ncbi:pectate lyase family protein [Arthrobacter sp. SA17]
MTVKSGLPQATAATPSRRSVLATGLAGGGLVAATSLGSGVSAAAATDGLHYSSEPSLEGSGFDEAGLPNSSALGGTVWSRHPAGFASLPGLGLDGTTGGAGGSIVHARTAAELRSFANASEALVVILHGSIVFDAYEKLRVQSNKSFLGAGSDAEVVNAGFKLINVANVIFRNFTVRDSYIPGDFEGKRPDNDRDGIQVDTSHHIWVDHMYFTRLGTAWWIPARIATT